MSPYLLLAEATSLVDAAAHSLTHACPDTVESSIGRAVEHLRRLQEQLSSAAPAPDPGLRKGIRRLKDRIEKLKKLLKQMGTFCQGVGDCHGRGQIRYRPAALLQDRSTGPGRFLGSA